MNKDKWSYVFITLIIFFTVINILVYTNVLPFIIWKISNKIIMLAALFILFKRRKIKEKDKKLTILGFALLFIWVGTETIVLLQHI